MPSSDCLQVPYSVVGRRGVVSSWHSPARESHTAQVRAHHPLAAALGEGQRQFFAGLYPSAVFRRLPEFARHGVPGEVQQMVGAHLVHDFSGPAGAEKIALMPVHSFGR